MGPPYRRREITQEREKSCKATVVRLGSNLLDGDEPAGKANVPDRIDVATLRRLGAQRLGRIRGVDGDRKQSARAGCPTAIDVLESVR